MSQYRDNLPQMDGGLFVTDGGIETALVYLEGIDLPHFASFDLLRDVSGKEVLHKQFAGYAAIAKSNRVGCILETPTWRASADWGDKMGYSKEALHVINEEAIHMLKSVRDEFETKDSPVVVSGCLGPRGDGYIAGELMSTDEAQKYHTPQIAAFDDAGADMVCGLTMTYVEEAIGITRAAQAHNIPVAISFTVETDGLLPTGQSLKDAIAQVDAETSCGPVYYMINCAHPSHFGHLLENDEDWLQRIRGIRANASALSHAELDASTELDDGDPVEFGAQYKALRGRQTHINVLGGCCGTDHRHIEHVCGHCAVAA